MLILPVTHHENLPLFSQNSTFLQKSPQVTDEAPSLVQKPLEKYQNLSSPENKDTQD
jgi:hypothetical protein